MHIYHINAVLVLRASVLPSEGMELMCHGGR